MEKHGQASGRQYGIHEYVGIFSKHSERTERQIPYYSWKESGKNPLKCEYFLPFVVDELLGEKKATVKVLKSMDKWYGVTYKEDKPVVVAAIQKLKDEGLYPQKLWEEK